MPSVTPLLPGDCMVVGAFPSAGNFGLVLLAPLPASQSIVIANAAWRPEAHSFDWSNSSLARHFAPTDSDEPAGTVLRESDFESSLSLKSEDQLIVYQEVEDSTTALCAVRLWDSNPRPLPFLIRTSSVAAAC